MYVWITCTNDVSKDYSEVLGPKHKSELGKTESVLAKHFQKCFELPKHFWKCFALAKHFWNFSVRPVHPYWREAISTLHTEKLSRNRRLQENLESRQILFFCAPSVLLIPPKRRHLGPSGDFQKKKSFFFSWPCALLTRACGCGLNLCTSQKRTRSAEFFFFF